MDRATIAITLNISLAIYHVCDRSLTFNDLFQIAFSGAESQNGATFANMQMIRASIKQIKQVKRFHR